MKMGGRQHPVETLVEWVAPIPLPMAVGWAARQFGLSPIEAAALGLILLIGGFAALKVVGRRETAAAYQFQPTAFEESEELGELLLEAKDEVLLLDDPLIQPDGDSRVVRLFARQEPTPGELADRIEGFLGEMGRDALASPAEPAERLPADASAALYAALANVRASLR